MRSILYDAFGQTPVLSEVPVPKIEAHGALVRVAATGLCRSDWHAWKGHDSLVVPPMIPGHEFAGTIEAVGREVRGWQPGDRVTMPFVEGCGRCAQCGSGHQHICDHQTQPGFTHPGSFAELLAVRHAEINLVRLPEEIDSATAASLGCRFATAFRAMVFQARVQPGQWVAVHGAGGLGLSAIMIAGAMGARVIAIDIREDALAWARSIGAEHTINASAVDEVVGHLQELTQGGAHVSLDALGHPQTCFNSIASLRKRGIHVQGGLMLANLSRPTVPMDLIVAHELRLVGTHGMQAHHYPQLIEMIRSQRLQPQRLIGRRIKLEEAGDHLATMDTSATTGMTIIALDGSGAPGTSS